MLSNKEIEFNAQWEIEDPLKVEREDLLRDVEAFSRRRCFGPNTLKERLNELESNSSFIQILGEWIIKNVLFKNSYIKPFEFWVYRDGHVCFPDYSSLYNEQRIEELMKEIGVFEKYEMEVPEEIEDDLRGMLAIKNDICPNLLREVWNLANYLHIEHDYCIFVVGGEWKTVYLDSLTRLENLPEGLIELAEHDVDVNVFRLSCVNIPYPRYERMAPFLADEKMSCLYFGKEVKLLFEGEEYSATISCDQDFDEDYDHSFDDYISELIWDTDFANKLKERFSDIYLETENGEGKRITTSRPMLLFDFDTNRRCVIASVDYYCLDDDVNNLQNDFVLNGTEVPKKRKRIRVVKNDDKEVGIIPEFKEMGYICEMEVDGNMLFNHFVFFAENVFYKVLHRLKSFEQLSPHCYSVKVGYRGVDYSAVVKNKQGSKHGILDWSSSEFGSVLKEAYNDEYCFIERERNSGKEAQGILVPKELEKKVAFLLDVDNKRIVIKDL